MFEANGCEKRVVLDGLMDDDDGYELVDEREEDWDSFCWSLLDLPENVYGRLANESRHSLI